MKRIVARVCYKKNEKVSADIFVKNSKNVLLFAFICFFVTTSNAQEWIFNLKLNIRPAQWHLYNNEVIENNNSEQFFPLYSASGSPFFAYFEDLYLMLQKGSVNKVVVSKNYSRRIHPRFFEGEIMLDLYRQSPKLLYGMGWASNQGMLYAGVLSNGTIAIDPENSYYSVYIDGFTFNSHQFYVYANRQLGKEDGWLRHHFIGGLGIDIASGLNRKEAEFLVPSVQENHEGYRVKTTPLIKNAWPSLIAKYELEFRTKSGKNILGLNLTYSQGLRTIYEHSVTASMADGSFLTSKSTSKGSGFRLGISKTFQYKKPTAE